MNATEQNEKRISEGVAELARLKAERKAQRISPTMAAVFDAQAEGLRAKKVCENRTTFSAQENRESVLYWQGYIAATRDIAKQLAQLEKQS